MEDQEAYVKAKRKVEAKIGFYTHLAVYVGVNILLIIINLLTSSEYLWFKWPLMGWSIGLFFHGLGAFCFVKGSSAIKGSTMKERMIEKEMKREADKSR